jgi:hypothetical protein
MPMSHLDHESLRLADNKKPPAIIDSCRIRWRLGWHGGGLRYSPGGSAPPSFDGFALCSVLRLTPKEI